MAGLVSRLRSRSLTELTRQITQSIGYAVAIETTHFEVCMEKLTHTNTHAHTQRAIAICTDTHTMPTDENIFQNVIFVCLFIY